MHDISVFYTKTKVIHGPGSSERVGELVAELGAKKTLLVTGPTLAKEGLADRIAGNLRSAGLDVTVFSEIEPEPSSDTVARGAELAKSAGAELIVGLGGGSNLDAAKAIAVVVANGGEATDYEGQDKFVRDPMPIVALPTTAGTASEVTFYSVVTDTKNERKFIITSPRIAPKIAILDPALCASAPTKVVVAAGMDALTHSIESYTSRLATPITQAIAIHSIKLIHESIRRVVADPGDREAMGLMQIASCMVGFSFSLTRLGIVHAIALPVGARFGVPHGIANAILLPDGMRFNAFAVPELYADIARAMGVETCEEDSSDSAETAIEMVEAIAEDIGAPRTLREVGAKEDQFPAMAKDAMRSGHVPVNPRPFDAEDVIAIYKAAF